MLYPLAKQTIAINVIMSFLSAGAVILRLVARRKTELGLHSDDYVIFAAFAMALAICATGIWAGAMNIFGKDFTAMTLRDYSLYQKVLRIDALFCYIGFALVKVSVLLLYKRLFPIRNFKWVCYVVIAMSSAFSFAIIMAQIFSQKPYDKGWDLPLDLSVILDYRPRFDFATYLLTVSVVNMSLDILVLLLPVPLIVSLHMSTPKRLSLFAIFGTGAFCIIASAVRISYCVRAYQATHGIKQPYNMTQISCWNDLWAHIELCSSIVAATLPTLAPLVKGQNEHSSNIALFFSLCARKLSSYRKVRSQDRDSPIPSTQFCSVSHTSKTTTVIEHIQPLELSWQHEKLSVPAQPQVIYVQKGFGYREYSPI